MKIGYDVYEIQSEELKEVARRCLAGRKRMFDGVKKFARKYGAKTNPFATLRLAGSRTVVVGVAFKEPPDERLWKKVDGVEGYKPKKNSKEARAIFKDFDAIPRWSWDELVEKIKWQDIWSQSDSMVYFFNIVWNEHNDFFAILVPKFSRDHRLENRSSIYKPVKGMKKISWDTMEDKHRFDPKKAKRKRLPQESARG